jgi:glycosyltransferase involved in cell wall biosynthesis
MTESSHIGLLQVGSLAWYGGIQYTNNLVRAISEVAAIRPAAINAVTIFTREDTQSLLEHPGRSSIPFNTVVLPAAHIHSGGIKGFFARKTAALHQKLTIWKHGVDVLYPVTSLSRWRWFRDRSIGWIPDFQHRTLPEMFSTTERRIRDLQFRELLTNARTVVLSSETARTHAQRYFPEASAVLEVLPFHVDLPSDVFQSDSREVHRKYGLPERYLICSNQFWAHKDHATLFRALAIARTSEPHISLVCTGRTSDVRHHDHFESLLRLAAKSGIMPNLQILGLIPRADQAKLLHASQAVIQPSLAEGWSTVIEDARCLGRPLILSRTEIHAEQAPPDTKFFAPGDPPELAQRLIEAWHASDHPRLSAPELKHAATERMQLFASRFLGIVERHRRITAHDH